MTTRICVMPEGGPCDTLMRNQRLAHSDKGKERIADQLCDGCMYELALPHGLEVGDQALYWRYDGAYWAPKKSPVLCTIVDVSLRSKTKQVKIEIDGEPKWVASHNITRRE